MALDLDRHCSLDSPLHRLEPRCRLIGLGALIAGFAVAWSPPLVAAMLVVAGVVLAASGLPIGFVASRLKTAVLFLLALGLMLPLVSGGPVLWELGPLAIHADGLRRFAIILAKFVAIGSTAVVLFGCAPLPVTVVAMQRLGLPSLIADMTLFSYRAMHEIGNDLALMRTAAGLRGLRLKHASGGAAVRLAGLVGSLFVTSHARAEQVHRAMILRGYATRAPVSAATRPDAGSIAFAAAAVAVGIAFIAAEVLLAGGAG